MKKVYILGRVRGFLQRLTLLDNESIRFIGDGESCEVPSKYKEIISKMMRTKIVGFWGVFKVTSPPEKEPDCDIYLSFNRFVKSDKPYIIYLENPTALCHYSLACLKSPFVKKKLIRQIKNTNLVKIVCMCKACETTIGTVLGIEIPKEKVTQIYPCVRSNPYVGMEAIQSRCYASEIKLLYIAQGWRFYSKGGLEIIAAYERVQNMTKASLTIITNIDKIDDMTLGKIHSLGINLVDFKLPYEELEKVYAEHSVLLQPSSDDSYGLTVLEAMKAGEAIIASSMYAFKEMVVDGLNGYLVSPSYYFFDKNDLPNPIVWDNRKETIYARKTNDVLVNALYERIMQLSQNRELLCRMSLASWKRTKELFDEEVLIRKWEKILRDC